MLRGWLGISLLDRLFTLCRAAWEPPGHHFVPVFLPVLCTGRQHGDVEMAVSTPFYLMREGDSRRKQEPEACSTLPPT